MQKAVIIREKSDQFDFNKMENFCLPTNTVKKVKGKPQPGRNIRSTYIWQRARIVDYLEHIKSFP